jgi:putative ABC transport system permease protein
VWHSTWKGILARKLRLTLTAFAIVLGVSFVVGSFVLTDTLTGTFNHVLSQANAGVDIFVQAHSDHPASAAVLTPVPEDLAATVQGVPGVAAVDGRVLDINTVLYDKHGKPIDATQHLGYSMGPLDVLNIAKLRSGHRPIGGSEVAIDQLTADKYHYKIGDRIKLNPSSGAAAEFRIVGIVGYGSEPGVPQWTLAAFDTATAQRLFNAGNTYKFIAVAVQPGANVNTVRAAIQARLPGGVDALSAADYDAQNSAQLTQGFSDLNRLLLLFASIGVVAGFVMIFNTFSILVTQRLRELGLLRALGASGAQVTRSVLIEAAVVGVLASMLGIIGGVAVAAGLLAIVSHFFYALPSSDLVVSARTVLFGVGVGLVATLFAALIPARRAARIPPVAAMSETNPLAKVQPGWKRGAAGAAIAVAGLVVSVIALTSDLATVNIQEGVIVALAGVVLFGLGVAIASPLIARPFAAIIGHRAVGVLLGVLAVVALAGGAVLVVRTDSNWRIAIAVAAVAAAVCLAIGGRSLLGVSGRLARRNAARNPRRTALTSVALMIGVSLVVVVTTLATSAKATLEQSISSGLRAQLLVTPPSFGGYDGFPPQAIALIGKQPDVAAVAAVRSAMVDISGGAVAITGIDPAAAEQVANFRFSAGRIDGLSQGGVIMYADAARARGYHLGDQVPVTFSQTGTVALRLVGVFDQSLIGPFGPLDTVVSTDTYLANVGVQTVNLAWVLLKPGVDVNAADHRLTAVLSAKYPGAEIKSQVQFQQEQEHRLDQVLVGFYALMALAVLIALLGIVNTIFLSVYERTRELGLLRAVGMLREQVRAMVRGEAVIIAVLGALLGVLVGGLGGWTLTRSLRGKGLTAFSVPYVQLLVFVIVAAVAGVLTSVLPAWRAARLNVLDAIAVEFFSTGDRRDRATRPSRRKRSAGRKNSNGLLLPSAAPRAISSGVERFPDTEEVRGSNPLSPTTPRRTGSWNDAIARAGERSAPGVVGVPVDEKRAEEAPVDHAPVDDAPVDQAPVDHARVPSVDEPRVASADETAERGAPPVLKPVADDLLPTRGPGPTSESLIR